MIHLERVATEIKDIGLYNLILEDVQKIAKKKDLSVDDIIEILKKHPNILEDYKQLNVEYNLSNIHLRDIDLNKINPKYKEKAKKINENLKKLRQLEKYTLDFEQSSVLIIIFSIEFFVIFSVQYFIVLLNLKEWQTLIYAIFLSTVLVAWWYAKKERKKYEKNSKIFYDLYDETLKLLDELEKEGAIKKEDLIIKECDEHV